MAPAFVVVRKYPPALFWSCKTAPVAVVVDRPLPLPNFNVSKPVAGFNVPVNELVGGDDALLRTSLAESEMDGYSRSNPLSVIDRLSPVMDAMGD